jgi:hypothetical protein
MVKRDEEPVAAGELVVVASWITQKEQGGGVFVTVDGHPLGEILRKRTALRKRSMAPRFTLELRVHATGVARRHRIARFSEDVTLEPDEGLLVVVYCAHGYLWPLRRSQPARVELVAGIGLAVPKSHRWRIGFSQTPDGGRLLQPSSPHS